MGEFAEAIMRLAKAVYPNEALLSSCLELFMSKHFCKHTVLFSLDDFRFFSHF